MMYDKYSKTSQSGPHICAGAWKNNKFEDEYDDIYSNVNKLNDELTKTAEYSTGQQHHSPKFNAYNHHNTTDYGKQNHPNTTDYGKQNHNATDYGKQNPHNTTDYGKQNHNTTDYEKKNNSNPNNEHLINTSLETKSNLSLSERFCLDECESGQEVMDTLFGEDVWSVRYETATLTVPDASFRRVANSDAFEKWYTLDRTPISKGEWADVFRCQHRVTGQYFAAKITNPSPFVGEKMMAERLHLARHEALTCLYLSTCRHVINLQDVFLSSQRVVLVLELAEGGDLQLVLEDAGFILSEAYVRKVMVQLFEALEALHELDVAHLDIKPNNILMKRTNRFEIKLIDFEVSRIIQRNNFINMLGTPDYVAPEALSLEPLSKKTDMWSVGVLMHALLTGFLPFGSDGQSDVQTFHDIKFETIDYAMEDWHDKSAESMDLVQRMLIRQPEKRISPSECLKHAWIHIEVPPDPTLILHNDLLQSNNNKTLPNTPMDNVNVLDDFSQLYNTMKGDKKDYMSYKPGTLMYASSCSLGGSNQDLYTFLSRTKSREVLAKRMRTSKHKKLASRSREKLLGSNYTLSKSELQLSDESLHPNDNSMLGLKYLDDEKYLFSSSTNVTDLNFNKYKNETTDHMYFDEVNNNKQETIENSFYNCSFPSTRYRPSVNSMTDDEYSSYLNKFYPDDKGIKVDNHQDIEHEKEISRNPADKVTKINKSPLSSRKENIRHHGERNSNANTINKKKVEIKSNNKQSIINTKSKTSVGKKQDDNAVSRNECKDSKGNALSRKNSTCDNQSKAAPQSNPQTPRSRRGSVSRIEQRLQLRHERQNEKMEQEKITTPQLSRRNSTIRDTNRNISRSNSIRDTNKTLSRSNSIRDTNKTLSRSNSIRDTNKTLSRSNSIRDTNKTLSRSNSIRDTNKTLSRSNSIRDTNKTLSRSSSIRDTNRTIPQNTSVRVTNKNISRNNSINDSNKKIARNNSITETRVNSRNNSFKETKNIRNNLMTDKNRNVSINKSVRGVSNIKESEKNGNSDNNIKSTKQSPTVRRNSFQTRSMSEINYKGKSRNLSASSNIGEKRKSLIVNKNESTHESNNKIERPDTLCLTSNGIGGQCKKKTSNSFQLFEPATTFRASEFKFDSDEAYVSLEDTIDDGIFSRSESMESDCTIASDHTLLPDICLNGYDESLISDPFTPNDTVPELNQNGLTIQDEIRLQLTKITDKFQCDGDKEFTRSISTSSDLGSMVSECSDPSSDEYQRKLSQCLDQTSEIHTKYDPNCELSLKLSRSNSVVLDTPLRGIARPWGDICQGSISRAKTLFRQHSTDSPTESDPSRRKSSSWLPTEGLDHVIENIQCESLNSLQDTLEKNNNHYLINDYIQSQAENEINSL